MTAGKFWNLYTNNDISDIFEEICDFFSKELPHEHDDIEEFNEVIFETFEYLERDKNFDKFILFKEILIKNNLDIYKGIYAYVEDLFIEYFCLKQDKTNLNRSFSYFIEDPLCNFDIYLKVFKKLLYYQQTDLLEKAISENFETVSNSEDLFGNANYDLGVFKYYMIFQEVYNSQKDSLDETTINLKLSEYDFEVDEEEFSAIQMGLFEPQPDLKKLNDLYKNDKHKAIILLQSTFQKYMLQKGFEFYLSGDIWDEMYKYWTKNIEESSVDNISEFFFIELQSFEKHLACTYYNFLIPNKHEATGIVWSSVYIYEFLYENGFISKSTFDDFLEISKNLKAKLIVFTYKELWRSSYVHQWQKPDCISGTEFLEEDKIFKKSFSFKFEKFSDFKNELSEELSRIGDLKDYILSEGIKFDKKISSEAKKSLFDIPKITSGDYNDEGVQQPIKAEKKVGRNEPCPCGSGKKYKKCCLNK